MVYHSSALAQLRHIALLTLYSTAAIRGGGFARQWRISTPFWDSIVLGTFHGRHARLPLHQPGADSRYLLASFEPAWEEIERMGFKRTPDAEKS